MIRALCAVARPRRSLIAAVVGLFAAAAVLESVGLSLFIPVIQALTSAQAEVAVEPQGGLAALVPWYRASSAHGIQGMVWVLVGVLCLKNLFSYIAQWLMYALEFLTIRQLRQRLFRTYLSAPLSLFAERQHGRVVGDILHETAFTGQALTCWLELVGALITMTLLYVILLVLISWKATLLSTALLLALSVGMQRLSPISKGLGTVRQGLVREIMALTTEVIGGIRQVKLFAMEPRVTERFDDLMHQVSRVNAKIQAVTSLPKPVSETAIVCALGGFLLLICGGALGYPAAIVSLLIVFVLVLSRLLPLAALANSKLVALRSYAASVEAVRALLKGVSVECDGHARRRFMTARHRIRFEEVGFAYPGAPEVLRGVTLACDVGQVTAIVGPSGAGKSTLIDLLMRLYAPTQGRLLIDGVDLKEYELASWRRAIGFVTQETFIFNASIRDNILFAYPEASEEDVRWAARQADAHEFIERMPQGYETIVGERGLKLSGGQRQRLAIARAIVRRPQILIFDEATSSLDRESEQRVQRAIERIREHRTVILVAHRLSTVSHADRIAVLDQGRIVEEGTHDELLRRQGLYWKLYAAYGSGTMGIEGIPAGRSSAGLRMASANPSLP